MELKGPTNIFPAGFFLNVSLRRSTMFLILMSGGGIFLKDFHAYVAVVKSLRIY